MLQKFEMGIILVDIYSTFWAHKVGYVRFTVLLS